MEQYKATMELRNREVQSDITPERLYYLIYVTTGNREQAEWERANLQMEIDRSKPAHFKAPQ